MTPIIPDRPHALDAELVVITRPAAEPLPASIDAGGLVMTEWELSAEDLARLLEGGRVRLWVQTGGQPWQHVLLEVVE